MGKPREFAIMAIAIFENPMLNGDPRRRWPTFRAALRFLRGRQQALRF
jgi:hypothetical protein